MTNIFEDPRSEQLLDAYVPEQTTATRESVTPEIADRLLGLLSTDDIFRTLFQENPRAALAQLGHETPAAHLGKLGMDPVMPFLHFRGGLASKAKIAAAHETMMRTYHTESGNRAFWQFDLCS